jgi:hypothetical protein
MPTEAPADERSGFDAAVTIDDELIPANGIAIYVAGLDKRLSASIESELVFGRKVPETKSKEPMLDFSDLGGYQLGMSRRHAKVRRAGNGYEVIDLSSRNGTWLNNERLVPEKPYPLANGAQLQLGRMRLYVFHRTGGSRKKP